MILEYLNSLGQESRNECQTVGGPDPGKSCIFPFKFQDKIYNECPFDPDDQSKTWCSTKVDSNGNHVVGQKKWGHCSASCPETDKKETYFSGMRQFQISKTDIFRMKEKYAIIRMYFIQLTNIVFDREIAETCHKNLN